MEMVSDFVLSSLGAMVATLRTLAIPFLLFIALGLVLRGRKLGDDARRVLPESALNIAIILFNVVFITPILVLLSQGVTGVLDRVGWTPLAAGVWADAPPILVAFLAVFVGDFVGYWRHRLEHVPLLWPTHAVHHSDRQMTWLTLERFHPVNRLTTFFIDSTALILLGFPPYALVVNNITRHYYGFFIHADVPWTLGKLNWVMVSPAMHRWHHAADPRYFQKNFATVFSVFDRAFGTYLSPGPCTAPLGVTDPIRVSLWAQFTYMFEPRAYRLIRAGRAGLLSWRDVGDPLTEGARPSSPNPPPRP